MMMTNVKRNREWPLVLKKRGTASLYPSLKGRDPVSGYRLALSLWHKTSATLGQAYDNL